MASKSLLFSFLLLILSASASAYRRDEVMLPCITELIPCLPYLNDPTNPPPTCCILINQEIIDDAECLCSVFNNPNLVKGLNVTIDSALRLAKACGTKPDTSLCSTGGSPTNSPSAAAPDHSTPTKSGASRIDAASVIGALFLFGSSIVSSLF